MSFSDPDNFGVRGRRDFRLPHMALRGRVVVALVERRGGYYTDVVCDARTIMRALQRTSVQTVSPRCHSVTGLIPLVAGIEILCCKVAKSCGCAFLMGRALQPKFQHFLHLIAQRMMELCSPDPRLARRTNTSYIKID